MKRFITLILMISISLSALFAYYYPNILINGHLGQDIPPSIVLEVNSTVVDDTGEAVGIMDNFDFTNNRSSYSVPLYVYIGYSSYNNTSNILFNLTVSTEGFKEKDSGGSLIGSPLDVDIQFHTQTLDSATSKILNGASYLDLFEPTLFLDAASTPISYIYTVDPGASINDPNYQIWFTWSEKDNAPAGQYGALINFSITSS